MKCLAIFCLFAVSLVLGSCASDDPSHAPGGADNASESRQRAEDVQVLAGISGTAFDCEHRPLPEAMVALTRMPDSLLNDTSGLVRRMRFFRDTTFYRSTTSDSAGNYTFVEVPLGSYQVILLSGKRPAGKVSWTCGASAVDFVKVIGDSIAMVDVLQINKIIEVVHMARRWSPRYDPLQ